MQQLIDLLLLIPPEQFLSSNDPIHRFIHGILKGKSNDLLEISDFKEIHSLPPLQQILRKYPEQPLYEVLTEYTDEFVKVLERFSKDVQLWTSVTAVCFFQSFIQSNFTGPSSFPAKKLWFPKVSDEKKLQYDCIDILNVEGQSAYDLMHDPLYLIMAELFMEKVLNVPSITSNHEELLSLYEKLEIDTPIKAFTSWWLVRTLQTHLSIVSEPPGIISSICGILMSPKLIELFDDKLLSIEFYLELARIHIHSNNEHLAIKPLIKATKLSGLQVLLSGAKAKRTKFQQFFTSNLIVLAKSAGKTLFEDDIESSLESLQLNDDVLLEKPQFESLEDLEIEIEQDSKRIRMDSFLTEDDKLLPLALKQDDIPNDLKELDPNNQPTLNNVDNLSILLRLAVLKQTSPTNDPLVDEELMALVSRIVYSGSNINWSIFSRSLWERSLLETGKTKTVERGILQMTALIEEIGINITSRVTPQVEDSTNALSSRLRFIHQLPLLPQWVMDAKLAEKYMSLGVIKSALEIYQRLGLDCEAALCYAAVDQETEAEKILTKRIENYPKDARAISILGDLKQDPQLWEKAWEIGKYAKAKSSLSKYYYNQKNLQLAIKNMFESLSINPLNYENWFFYGCCGLENGQFELASEAFSRCISLDDTNSYAWSNLASALLKLNKDKPAFNALKKAIRCGSESKSWRIYENYMNVAVKLHEWNGVLFAFKELLKIKKDEGDKAIDIPVLEKLVEILVSEQYSENLTYFQKSTIDLVCNILPTVITSSARCWRIVARVELWRMKPWNSLECHEKAYRTMIHLSEVETNESVWNEVVDACCDLVSAFESLGELPGKYGADDLVCKDWKYKARTTIRSLMSKGKDMWEDSEGWERLKELKESF
ncbi:unnamed protein product [Candida verbasci]|uniref:Uncharacterized protein n=1 Tax=Candida verbasci TaxID=1227364 RepID=A0A9W4XB46_9ASCO|nr:unnamed protein product [Candida verbasci]